MDTSPMSNAEQAEAIARVVVVTGVSGAGKSSALRAFEDLGFETVDNLPLALMPAVARADRRSPLALGVDVRTRDFDAPRLLATLDQLKRQAKLPVSIL